MSGTVMAIVVAPLAILRVAQRYRRLCPASFANLPHYPVPAEKP